MASSATAALALRFSPLSPTIRTLQRPSSLLSLNRTPPAVAIFPRSRFSMSTAVPAAERLISALSYSLPFLNSLHYGRLIFARFPSAAAALQPILPLAAIYRSVPYAPFAAFFALYLGVARNPSLGRYARFNAMQAVVLDVLLSLPALVQRVLGASPSGNLGFRVLEICYGTLFTFAAVCFLYGASSSVLGRTPYLPFVAAAANRQL